MSALSTLSVVGWVVSVGAAGVIRGRRGAIVTAILIGIYSLVAVTLVRYVGPALPAFVYIHATVYVSFVLLARRTMPPLLYRILVSFPASWFLASTLLAFPWCGFRST